MLPPEVQLNSDAPPEQVLLNTTCVPLAGEVELSAVRRHMLEECSMTCDCDGIDMAKTEKMKSDLIVYPDCCWLLLLTLLFVVDC